VEVPPKLSELLALAEGKRAFRVLEVKPPDAVNIIAGILPEARGVGISFTHFVRCRVDVAPGQQEAREPFALPRLFRVRGDSDLRGNACPDAALGGVTGACRDRSMERRPSQNRSSA
jgi:hypothetical protein